MPRVRTVGDRVSSRDSFSVWEFLRKRESKILKRRTWATCKLRKAKRQGYHIRFAYGDIVGPFWLLDIYLTHVASCGVHALPIVLLASVMLCIAYGSS